MYIIRTSRIFFYEEKNINVNFFGNGSIVRTFKLHGSQIKIPNSGTIIKNIQ